MSNKKEKIIRALVGSVMACAMVVGVTNAADMKSAAASNVKTEFSTDIPTASSRFAPRPAIGLVAGL